MAKTKEQLAARAEKQRERDRLRREDPAEREKDRLRMKVIIFVECSRLVSVNEHWCKRVH